MNDIMNEFHFRTQHPLRAIYAQVCGQGVFPRPSVFQQASFIAVCRGAFWIRPRWEATSKTLHERSQQKQYHVESGRADVEALAQTFEIN